MAIDLPSSSQISLRGTQNSLATTLDQRQGALQAALNTLNIREGEAARALVKSVSTVDDTLRARLITLANPTTETAASTGSRAAGNAAPAATLGDNLASLLKSQALKLVEIDVKGRSLLTFTDQPVKAGAEIAVQLNRGRLLLLPQAALDRGALGTGVATAASTQSGPTALASGALASGAAPAPLDSKQLTAMQQELRQLLPKQAPGNAVLSETLVSAALLAKVLALPVNSNLRQQLPPSLQQSLQLLASHLRTPQQLSQPALLKQTLANSGLQLEHRLAAQTGTGSAPGNTASAAATLPGAPLLGLARGDLKAALLLLSTQLQALTVAPAQHQQVLPTALLGLLKQLMLKPDSQKNLSTVVAKDQLLQQLQQQVGAALDKVMLQQLQALQRGPGASETAPTQHWQLEIPLRYGHEVQTMQLRIDQDWVQDYSESPDRTPRQVRQWLVKLAFELPAAGTLHAHLMVVDSSVSASLWAEQPQTLALTRQRLGQLQQRLEKDGVTVTKIECFAGKPAADKIRLDYSLVDVRT